jgi:mRNA interferase RelE/StbE
VAYRITLSSRAKRELDRVPHELFRKLDAAIWVLREEPRPVGCTKLKGPIHRIRVGRWRVIYAVFDKDQLVLILKVTQRTERTHKELPEISP